MAFFKKLAYGTSAAALLAMAPVAAIHAQETTAEMRGFIVDETGAPISGARVTILHEPTGAATVRTTGANGQFDARNLRVGGPYNITIAAEGFQPERAEGVFLQLGETFSASATLRRGAPADVVVVTGQAFGGELETGPRSRFTQEDIDALPSISRDPRDIARLSPFATVDPTNSDAISFAGQNNRSNSFTLDGVSQNDLFGLNASGFPSENRGPVSIEALEGLTVEVAPFDVEYGDFQGGTINAVTRSGTNEFHGSVFAFYTDDNLVGDASEDDTFTFDFEEKTYGATLGGPIVRDRLWFFASYETFERVTPLSDGPVGSGYTNEIPGITVAEANQVFDILENVYGLDLTRFDEAPADTEDDKLLVRLDWQITDNHRAQYTYNTSEGTSVQERRDRADLGTPSTWYIRAEELESHSVQIFSTWTDNLSTEVKLAYSTQDTGQDSVDGSDFAQFDITLPSGAVLSTGPDFFRHANALSNESWQGKFAADYVYGDHLFTAGYEFFYQDVFNLFVPGSEGSYDFASIADLQNRVASSLFYQNSVTNDENDAAAEFDYLKNTIYVQDEWTVSDALTLIGGLRYEWYQQDDAPTFNSQFEARYGFRNDANLDGLDIILPRFGFNYTPDWAFGYSGVSADEFTVRGGYGRFSGGSPLVWISNNFSNDGIAIDSVFVPGPITNVDAFNVPTSAQNALTAGDGDTNVLDPSFDIPNQWRFNIGVDFAMDFWSSEDWFFSVDYLRGDNEESPFWRDISCSQTGTSFDGRPFYNCGLGSRRQDILLTSVDGGHSDIWTVRSEKAFGENFETMFSYTYSDVEEVHPATSSTASSNYSDWASADRNNPVAARGNYVREHDFKLRLSWADDVLFDEYETRVELFATRRSGQPFSYTFGYSNGPGGKWRNFSPFGIAEGSADDEGALFYVPMTDASGNVTATSDPNVVYRAGFDVAAFNDYLHQTGLISEAGSITERNAYESDWTTLVDLRFQQEIPAFFPQGAKGTFYFDIENVGNLLNEDWGRYEQVNYEYFQPVVELYDITPTGQYVYDRFPQRDESRVYVPTSLWQIQFGVRYEF